MNAARKLLLGLLLCPLGMQGQTIVSAEYFVDNDPGVGNGTAVAVMPGTNVSTPISVPTGALSPGFHRIGVRHRDSNGHWSHSAARSVFVYAASFVAPPSAPVAGGEYFFGADPGVGNGTAFPVTQDSTTTTNVVIDASLLTPGFHRVSVRHKDANGRWGHTASRSLFIYAPAFIDPPTPQIVAGEYFFDTDPGVGNGTAFPVTAGNSTSTVAVIDVSALSLGFHRVGVRHKDANGKWSHGASRSFFVFNPAFTEPPTPQIVAGEYFFDADPGVGNGTAFGVTAGDSTSTAVVVDASALSPGFHRVGVRHKDANGKWSHSASRSLFIYAPAFTEAPSPAVVAGEYFFDTDPGVGNGTAFPVTAGNTTSTVAVIDVSALGVGFHRVGVRHKDASGKWGHASTRNLYIFEPAFTEPPSPSLVVGEYFFGADPGVGNGIAFSTGAVASTIAVDVTFASNTLPPGPHKVSVRVKDAAGRWGHASTQAFTVEDGGQAYRTINSGNWADPAIWERNDGGNWVPAGAAPTHVSGTITIRATHTVTVNASTTMDEVLVESDGALIVASTATVMDGVGFDVDVLGSLTITTGGLLTGTGSVRIVHQFFWTGGETGAGLTISITASGTSVVNCGCTLIHGGIIQNAGTWTVLNGNMHGSGEFNNLAGGVLSLQGAQDINNAWAIALYNAGSVQVNVALHYTFINSVFVNLGGGTVTVAGGELWVNGFTNSGGVICTGSGIIRVVGGSFVNNTGGYATNGYIVVQGGNLVANASLDILHLYILSGSVSGTGGIQVLGGGTLTCTGGSIVAGCVVNTAVTTVVTFNAPTVFYNYGSIIVGGPWNHVSGSLHGNGSVTVLSTAVVTITGVWDPYDSWQNALACHGAINVNVPVAFAFTGQVDVEVTGVATVANGVLWTYGFNNGGSLVCLGSSVLRISGGVFVHEVGGTT
ncbi:MAG TPA: hypothetical protein PKY96_12870, partial [Flavobacteriales bacterium]|nr:hypothetical protein [Flavobacteriales bacterium]